MAGRQLLTTRSRNGDDRFQSWPTKLNSNLLFQGLVEHDDATGEPRRWPSVNMFLKSAPQNYMCKDVPLLDFENVERIFLVRSMGTAAAMDEARRGLNSWLP